MSNDNFVSKASIFRKNWDLMKARHKRRRKAWGLDKKDNVRQNNSIYNNALIKQLIQSNNNLNKTLQGLLSKNTFA